MNILHIDTSPRANSHSRRLSAAILAQLVEAQPDAEVTRRDLATDPLSHPSADYAEAVSSPAALMAGQWEETFALSETLVRELDAADVIVLGTPMHNFTVPSALKAWLDQVLRVGRTMMPTPAGKVGTLRDRPVYVGIASGGVFGGEGANQPDFLTPLLTASFGCIGFSRLQFLYVQGTAFLSDEKADAAHGKAMAALDLGLLTEPA